MKLQRLGDAGDLFSSWMTASGRSDGWMYIKLLLTLTRQTCLPSVFLSQRKGDGSLCSVTHSSWEYFRGCVMTLNESAGGAQNMFRQEDLGTIWLVLLFVCSVFHHRTGAAYSVVWLSINLSKTIIWIIATEKMCILRRIGLTNMAWHRSITKYTEALKLLLIYYLGIVLVHLSFINSWRHCFKCKACLHCEYHKMIRSLLLTVMGIKMESNMITLVSEVGSHCSAGQTLTV